MHGVTVIVESTKWDIRRQTIYGELWSKIAKKGKSTGSQSSKNTVKISSMRSSHFVSPELNEFRSFTPPTTQFLSHAPFASSWTSWSIIEYENRTRYAFLKKEDTELERKLKSVKLWCQIFENSVESATGRETKEWIYTFHSHNHCWDPCIVSFLCKRKEALSRL